MLAKKDVGPHIGPGSTIRRLHPMEIRGSAPTLATTKTSPVLRKGFVPNAKVAVEVDSPRFFDLLIGRLSGK